MTLDIPIKMTRSKMTLDAKFRMSVVSFIVMISVFILNAIYTECNCTERMLSVVYFIVMLGGTPKFELKEKKFERNGLNFKTFL